MRLLDLSQRFKIRFCSLNLIYKCEWHRYTSLVRRNFLRFGKRSGTFPPLPSSLEGERGGEEEDGEELPFEERLEEEGEEQQEPFSRFPAHYVVEEPVFVVFYCHSQSRFLVFYMCIYEILCNLVAEGAAKLQEIELQTKRAHQNIAL